MNYVFNINIFIEEILLKYLYLIYLFYFLTLLSLFSKQNLKILIYLKDITIGKFSRDPAYNIPIII